MNVFSLTGLDAQNPLGYLTALGLLRVLDDRATRDGMCAPALYFEDQGRQIPILRTSLCAEEISSVVLDDAAEQRHSVALGLMYDEAGNPVEDGTPGLTRDLKPSPATAANFLREARYATRRDSDLAAGFFSELVQDNNGNTKPTALHFTAGQQKFLGMVEELRNSLSSTSLYEALWGPWLNSSSLPSLSWDASVTRDHALRASDPSKEKRGSVPAANWLAVHALGFFPVRARKRRLLTAGFAGGWKDASFTWPLWGAAGSAPVVASLLRLDAAAWTARERVAFGVSAVLRSKVVRSDQGGYGTFRPAEVVLPRRAR